MKQKKVCLLPASTRNSKVPRLRYFTAFAMPTAAATIFWRRSVESPGLGAISTIFWLRRWIVQSRSPKATIPPLPSPTIWTSMWRARSINRSA